MIRPRWRPITATLCVPLLALAFAACGDEESTSEQGSDNPVRLGVFLLATANTYSQGDLRGIEQVVKEDGNVELTKVFDGEFDGQVQVKQVEDAAATGNYDAFIIMPNDAVALATAAEEAAAQGVTVATAFAPLGPDPIELEPQIEGVVGTAAHSSATSGRTLGEQTIVACETEHPDADPCRVALQIGCKACTDDRVRSGEFKKLVEAADVNIEITSESEGFYLTENGYTTMQDVLQRDKNIDVLASVGDQMTIGAEQALDEAGVDDVTIVSTGASKEAVAKIRSGDWFASGVYLPETEGRLAAEMAIAAVRDEPIEDNAIDVVALSPIGPAFTRDSPEDFEAEWAVAG